MIGSKKLKIFLLFVLSLLIFPQKLILSQEVCEPTKAIKFGYLESPIFYLGNSYHLTKSVWQGEKNEKHFVGFQLASSQASSGPWVFYGSDFSSDYLVTEPNQIYYFNPNLHKNIKYFKYRIFLATCDELSTPLIDKIIIYYSQ
jgi:hypothetical protein